jgi:DNA-binding XRE family transcriptional regulator
MKNSKRPTHRQLVTKLMKDPKVRNAYNDLAPEFELLDKMLQARMAAGLTQQEVAKKMKTSTSTIGRLEGASTANKHSPKLETLKKYAAAIGYELKFEFIKIGNKQEQPNHHPR